MEVPKLFDSRKVKMGTGGVGVIVALVQYFGLPVVTGGYIIGGIIALNIFMQGLIDLKKEK